ncbi:MAG: FHA domain-containing protein, partial [Deltaproteobacteria bacterium]|nr:FHA domain-containing protein [Deltaproteobacteria bacterium]
MPGTVIQAFLFRDGNFLGTEMLLGERVEIGRDPACGLILDDDQVSRRHCALIVTGGQLLIEDLRSANGTTLNGERVTAARPIGPRDDVTIGRHVIKFKLVSSQPARPAPPPPPPPMPDLTLPDAVPPQHRGAPTQRAATRKAPVIGSPDPWKDLTSSPEKAAAAAAAAKRGVGARPPAPATPLAPAPALGADLFGDLSGLDSLHENSSAPIKVEFEIPPPPEDQPPWPAGGPDDRVPGFEIPPPAERPRPAPPQYQQPQYPPQQPQPRPATSPYAPRTPAPRTGAIALSSTPVSGDVAEASFGRAVPPMAGIFEPMEPVRGRPLTPPPAEYDDDEDEELPANFSLFKNLLTEPVSDGKPGRPQLVLIEYRDDQVRELTSLARGQFHIINKGLSRRDAREFGIPSNFRLARLRQNGDAEVAVLKGGKGKVRQGGATKTIEEAADWRGERGVLRMKVGDMATLQVGVASFIVRFGYAMRQLLQGASVIRTPEQRRDMRRLATSGGTSMALHFMVLLGMYIQSLLLPSPTVQQLAEDRFAEVDTKQLELQKPPEQPPPQEEPPPTNEPEPVTPEEPVRSKRVVSKDAKAQGPGILAALGKIPKMAGPAGGQTLVAAVSNLDAVKVPGGGGAAYKVSGLIGKGPTNRIQIGGSGGGVSTKGLASILREGGAGTLSKLSGGKVRGRLVKASRASKTRGTGYLDRAEIQKVVNKGIGQIQFCYEKELLKNQSLSGKVV